MTPLNCGSHALAIVLNAVVSVPTTATAAKNAKVAGATRIGVLSCFTRLLSSAAAARARAGG
jgi:hypothetical protein